MPRQGPAGSGGRSEQIGRRLDETFGTFDAAVRTAQADIAKERAAAEAAGSAGGEPGEEGESGEGGEGGAGGEGGEEAGSGPQREGGLESTGGAAGGEGEADGDGTGNASEGSSERAGGVGGGTAPGGKGPSAIPADIPDGRDDDIVARQIREAAMKETDPELREALWDEYRRYKKGR